MTLRVLFFSLLRDLTGTGEIELTCAEGVSTVNGLLGMLYERWPALSAWDASLLVAVDQTYAKRGDALHEGAEVAVMPPVQGG